MNNSGTLRAGHFLLLALLLVAPIVSAQGLQVIVAPVKETRLFDRIEGLGTLRANESANLTTTTTETITEIRFDDGQRVKSGQVLVVLSNREQVADRAEARAAVEEARRQHERVQDLASRGTASASLLDQRLRELDTARARLNAAEARLATRRIIAPFDGVVGLRNVSVGSLLTPGTIVTTIHDDSVMKLDFTVPELFISAVSPGLSIEAESRAFPGETFRGEVVSVGNEVDPVTRAVRVRALIPNPDRKLLPGMLMTLGLSSRERGALVIPEEALIARGREQSVFLAHSNGDGFRAQRRDVRIGVRRQGSVEILEGLGVDDQVIVHGSFRLNDGDRIRVRATMDGDRPLSEILSNRNGS